MLLVLVLGTQGMWGDILSLSSSLHLCPWGVCAHMVPAHGHLSWEASQGKPLPGAHSTGFAVSPVPCPVDLDTRNHGSVFPMAQF